MNYIKQLEAENAELKKTMKEAREELILLNKYLNSDKEEVDSEDTEYLLSVIDQIEAQLSELDNDDNDEEENIKTENN